MSPAAGRRLARMLGGEHPDLLAEWLTAATARGLRPPPQLLPALLDRARAAGRRMLGLPRLVAEAGGPRVRWLAGLNPEWELPAAETCGRHETWRLGDARPAPRLPVRAPRPRPRPRPGNCLAAAGTGRARRSGPCSFRSWRWAGPGRRAAAGGGARRPRGGGARWAAFLLASLPGSALGQRMAERALRCVRSSRPPRHAPERRPAGPARRRAAAGRDNARPGGGARAAGEPEPGPGRDAGRTPLGTWTDAFGLAAAQIVAVPAGDWAPVLFVGWSRAAVAQATRTGWRADRAALTGRRPGTTAEIEALRQLVRRADPALGAPGATPGQRAPDVSPPVRDALSVLRFRYDDAEGARR